MDYLQILFFVVYAITISVGVYILAAKPTKGNAIAAAMIGALFFGYTIVQIWSEGVVIFFTNHSANMTGLQVWWDLVMSVLIAFFFIVPRARAVGMNVIPWALFVATTASIGLLAMCARLFWLEQSQDASEAGKATPSTQAAT